MNGHKNKIKGRNNSPQQLYCIAYGYKTETGKATALRQTKLNKK